ncbi:MAG: tetratricopeptide repeat protein [Candidatus Symbiothrix sp.]|jgi:hypothetical protein|nr:tetratricopeptide repeat protein [Candidatus Symbiothrix sp.]
MFERRKFFYYFCFICLFFIPKAQAQTVDEAHKLFAAKNYAAAAPVYYQTYQFEKAVEAYNLVKAALIKAKKPAEAEALTPLIQQAERAARMLSKCEDIQIIDSVIMDKAHFLNAYLLGPESGSLATTGDGLVYENPLRDKRFYAEKNRDKVYRIYSEIKLQDQWTEKKELNLGADSATNDNYPFVMPDGLTVYFAANGKNSIGGYDLFLTRYNLNNDTYLAPNQLGMPFNSIYNDYMMAVDEINDIGYFATDRFQPKDKVVIYTFIPNDEFATVTAGDSTQLVQRAKLTSIRDTWKPGIDYVEYVTEFKNALAREQRAVTKKDFSFVINDNLVHSSLNDFQSPAAKQYFEIARQLDEERVDLQQTIDELRQEYAKASLSRQKQLRPDILSKEKKLEELSTQYIIAVKEARRLEN